MVEDLEQRAVYVGSKVPARLRELMEKFIEMDAHLNISDLIRDAVREKIQRDAPELYKSLFRETVTP